MADRYVVVYQGRIVQRRGLPRDQAEREAEYLARTSLKDKSDHVEIKKDDRFEREDNAIYRRYKDRLKGGS